MDFNLWEFILGNLEAAGVIGGYVSISIIGVGLITFATREKLSGDRQIGPKWAHPLIGGLLGIIPGCGATIVVSSMYKKKKITFGGLLATFVATLGEGSFVLLGASDEADVAANLTAFLVVNAVGLVVGVILGYVADGIGFRKHIGEAPEPVEAEATHEHKTSSPFVNTLVENVGFYLLLAMAAFLLPGSIMALWGGGIAAIEGITVYVAIALTVVSIIYYLIYRYAYHGNCCSTGEDIRTNLHTSVADITLVVFFVFIGLFVANFIIDVLVGPERFDAWMTSSAGVVVLIAALIGVTPGCGGMIAVAVAYTAIPNFPLPALIAAAIATSGDGIFPLLASDRKDALIVTGIGFAAALVVGYGALAIGI
ncbi:putative manganese transporter [Salinispira pacifica]|uniref:Uncharacterized protein n=1 Tax=Salinispira pacifica TaxID=1307761 RepID=V5WER6_9SPIO|nr:putative manganese transporter [Salinispira pacifica]AHC14024.1 hypothetical protein L21SP2_0595 [Salinispira pacifica]